MTKVGSNGVGIIVTPIVQSGDNVACEIDATAGNSSNVKGGMVKLKGGKEYDLQFALPSPNDLGLLFEADGDDAFWCCTYECPTKEGNGSGGWLSNPTVSPDQLTLTVHAAPPNGRKGMIFYRLNFNNGGSFDPIIIHN